MSERRGLRRLEGGLTAATMIAGAVAIAFGTGFTASRTVLGDGGAWLSSGRTVTHVNSGTGQPDATVEDDLVTDVGGQQVVTSTTGTTVLDTETGGATTIDTTTMSAGARTSLAEGDGPTRLVAAGQWSYLVRDTVVQRIDPATMEHRGPALRFDHIAGAVATAEGALAVLDADTGKATEIVPGTDGVDVNVARRPGRDTLTLTAVSGRPVVVDTEAGTVRRLRPGGIPEHPIEVPGLAGLDISQVAPADPHADGSTVWLARRDSGDLVGVDLERGRIRSEPLDDASEPGVQHTGDRLLSPVVYEGIVYVPHAGIHDVTVIDATSGDLRPLPELRYDDWKSDHLEVFVQDRRVWVNDPAADTALVVEPGGGPAHQVDKGTGRDAGDQDGPSSDPPDTAPASPSPQQPAADSDSPSTPAPTPRAPAPPAAPSPSPTDPGPAPQEPPPDIQVPDVVGYPYDEACRLIERAGFGCLGAPVQDAPDGVERDEVIGQDPEPGTRRPAFSNVTVDYYAPGQVDVPSLTGLRVVNGGVDPTQGPACQAVTTAELTCELTEIDAVDGQPADEVWDGSQQPAAGEQEHRGEPVEIRYSSTTFVPNVVGLAEVDACAAIVNLNLVCVPQHVPVGATAGAVIDQAPDASAEAAAGTAVTVTVPDATPTVPDVRGLDQTTACQRLAEQQLVCSWQLNPVNSINNPNLVDGTDPPPGTSLPPGTTVTIWHPAGPDLTLFRFRAFNGDTALDQWAVAPNGGGGTESYGNLTRRSGAWHPDGDLGGCYSTQVAGSIPLYAWMRSSSDPIHEFHFYAAGYSDDPNSQYQRGIHYYDAPLGVFCYVVPWATAGTRPVTEWWKDRNHYYNISAPAPDPTYERNIPHWATW